MHRTFFRYSSRYNYIRIVQTPKLPSMFRGVRIRPKGFNYTPRYYDPEKEALEKRIRLIEKEVEADQKEGEITKLRMRHNIQQSWGGRPKAHRDAGRSKRLLIILCLIILMLYMVYSKFGVS